MSDCTVCLDQLLEPDPPDNLVVVNNNGSLAFFERGGVAIGAGQTTITVQFVVPKISEDYTFNELDVSNVIDPSPFEINAAVVSRNKSEFTVALDTSPDTGSYFLRWEVQVNQI